MCRKGSPPTLRSLGPGSGLAISLVEMKTDFSIRLDIHRPGAPARIVAVEAGPEDQDRLECLGLCTGRTVEVVQAGDPMIVRVLGTRIGIAAVLAATVLVEIGSGV